MSGSQGYKIFRPHGSPCEQGKPFGRGKRGTSSFGSDSRFVEFPQMIITTWSLRSVQEVAWMTSGEYTYRLCKLGSKGRPGLTEECFARNVLEFATNFTMIKGQEWGETGVWEKFEQTDLREATYPEGSVWRPVGKIVDNWFVMRYFLFLFNAFRSLSLFLA